MTLPRRVTRTLWILLPILVLLGVARLRFDVEILDLLPGDVPAVAGLKLYQQHFANARAQTCMSCHNGKRVIAGRRVFGGDDFGSCARCHKGNSFSFGRG